MSSPSTLHPRLRTDAGLREVAAAWIAEGECVRIDSVLEPELADELARTIPDMDYQPYHLTDPTYGRCFFWRSVHFIERQEQRQVRMPPPLDRAADFVLRDLPGLVGAMARRVARIPEPRLGFCRWDKGCYLDVHNEIWDHPGYGWVLGLTREPWPEAEGGHLTFHGDDKVTPTSSRPPGWNTLDLYTVHPVQRWHSVPLVRGDRTRWTLAGLLIEPDEASS